MNQEEFKQIQKSTVAKKIADQMTNKQNRTLLMGRDDCGCFTHVFLKDLVVYRSDYDWDNELYQTYDETKYPVKDLIPFGDVHPEIADFEFCQLLKNMEINVFFDRAYKFDMKAQDRGTQQTYDFWKNSCSIEIVETPTKTFG